MRSFGVNGRLKALERRQGIVRPGEEFCDCDRERYSEDELAAVAERFRPPDRKKFAAEIDEIDRILEILRDRRDPSERCRQCGRVIPRESDHRIFRTATDEEFDWVAYLLHLTHGLPIEQPLCAPRAGQMVNGVVSQGWDGTPPRRPASFARALGLEEDA